MEVEQVKRKEHAMTTRFTIESNREYWEDPNTISIIDSNLHALEIDYVSKHLRPEHIIADIGCGNGNATLKYAERVKYCYGIERSKLLRDQASRALQLSRQRNVAFREGDILDLSDYKENFDVVVTQRVLINLPSWELQARAIDNVYRCLKKGGLYILVENTNDGNDIMNAYRKKVGLQPISVHWHNRFLDFDVFMRHIDKKFRLIERHGFNLYYLLTRIYVQMFASFVGSGKNAQADDIFSKSDRAARILFEEIGDRIVFADNPVLGPIQGIVLQRLQP